MFNKIYQICLKKRMRFNYLELPIAGLILMIGVSPSSANPITNIRSQVSAKPSQLALTNTKQANPTTDGIYLYGQSAQPEQLGQQYLVFKLRQRQIVGAVYMPQSEFACFSGTVDSKQLNLSVVDSYEQTATPYSIALQTDYPVATASNNPTKGERQLEIQGYYRISNVSANDRRILAMCQNNSQ